MPVRVSAMASVAGVASNNTLFIPYSQRNEKDIKEILTEVFHDFDEREVSREGKNKAFVEYTKSFGENMGIKMCGIMDTDGFHQASTTSIKFHNFSSYFIF